MWYMLGHFQQVLYYPSGPLRSTSFLVILFYKCISFQFTNPPASDYQSKGHHKNIWNEISAE